MEYNSDFDVRLATLGALGGDTAKTYDSTYDVDIAILEAIEQGGGQGMTYDQMKQLLAASGVTEILFSDASGNTATLDYAKVMQIGQGGGDYRCIDSVDALSGITSPKDGSLAYVAGKGVWKYFAHTGITSWLAYDVYLDSLTAAEINTMCANIVSYLQYGYLPTITVKLFQYNETAAYITGAQQYRLQPFGESAFVGEIQGEIVFSNVCFAQDAQAYISTTFLPKIFYTTFQKVNNVWSEVSSGDTGYRGFKNLATDEYARWIGENRAYRIVNTYDGLSAITGDYNGRIAYVKDHEGEEEMMVLTIDVYNNDWYYLNLTYGDYSHQFYIGANNSAIYSEYRWYNAAGADCGDWFNFNDHAADIPVKTTMENGAVLEVHSFEQGEEYAEHNELKVTYYIHKHNGSYPSINLYGYDGAIVSSGASTETITITIPAKGWYTYNDAVSGTNKWLEYKIYLSSLTDAELAAMMERYMVYKQELSILVLNTLDSDTYEDCYVEAHAGQPYDNNDQYDRRREVTFVGNQSGRNGNGVYPWYIVRNSSDTNHQWKIAEMNWRHIVTDDNVENVMSNLVRSVRLYQNDNRYGYGDGAIISIPVSGTVGGTIYSTLFRASDTDIWDTNCIRFNNNWCSFGGWFSFRPDGFIRMSDDRYSSITIPAYVLTNNKNDNWWVLDYCWHDEANSDQGGYAIAAVRVQEYSADTNYYKFELFVSLPADGYQDMYSVEINQEKSYTWTTQSGQSLDIQPSLYTVGRLGNEGNDGLGKTFIELS